MIKKTILVILITIITTVSVLGCSNSSSGPRITPGSSILPAASKPIAENATINGNQIKITGVLTYVDVSGLKMHYVDIESGNEYEVTYTGGTDIKNKYDSIMSARTMSIGDIYDVVCDTKGKATSIYENKKAWENSGITNFSVSEPSLTMTIGSTAYKYNSRTVVMSNASRINVAEIIDQDKVTARGIDKTIYSVTLDSGHGYISFTGIDDFVGGYVDIGTKMVYQVTKGMKVTAPEGEYAIQFSKGSLMGTKTVKVNRDQELTVDFSEFKTEAVKSGTVKFSVTPTNAVMYIDGTQVDYSEPIVLDYGRHTVVLNANNYNRYTATINVNATYLEQVIDMTATTTAASTTKASTKSTTSSTKSSTSTSSSTSSTTKATTASTSSQTSGYYINIKGPEGAVVYADSVYLGTAPVSMIKTPGKKIIILTKAGCETKSYTIEVPDESGDVEYSFPDMEAITGFSTE